MMSAVALCCPLRPEGSSKTLLLTPKRRIPKPSSIRATGQGKGQPKSGLGIPPIINIESMINQKPANIESHFDPVNIFYPPLVSTAFFK